MNPYLLMGLSMAVALLSGVGTKLYLNKYNKGLGTRYLFSTVQTLLAVIALLIIGGNFNVSVFTLLLGLGFGLLTGIQKVFNMKALEIGPWAYTTVISSLSTIIPTLSGAVIWGEQLRTTQIIGVVLMMVCIYFSVDFKKEKRQPQLASQEEKPKNKATVKWLIFCGITFLSTGFIGVFQKWHQKSDYRSESAMFLIIAFIVTILVNGVLAIKGCKQEGGVKAFKPALSIIPIAIMVLSGVAVALNNKWNLHLSGVLPSVVMFPVVNGGGLILTTLFATFVFREKLTLKQWIGMAIGFIALFLICFDFSVLFA